MFSLIITLVAVVLVAALSLASLYYGSDALNRGASDTLAAQALQEGNQVVGALALYRTLEGALPAGPTSADVAQALRSGNYLTQQPSDKWSYETDHAVFTGLTAESCEAINARLSITGVPSCSDPLYAKRNVCCVD